MKYVSGKKYRKSLYINLVNSYLLQYKTSLSPLAHNEISGNTNKYRPQFFLDDLIYNESYSDLTSIHLFIFSLIHLSLPCLLLNRRGFCSQGVGGAVQGRPRRVRQEEDLQPRLRRRPERLQEVGPQPRFRKWEWELWWVVTFLSILSLYSFICREDIIYCVPSLLLMFFFSL